MDVGKELQREDAAERAWPRGRALGLGASSPSLLPGVYHNGVQVRRDSRESQASVDTHVSRHSRMRPHTAAAYKTVEEFSRACGRECAPACNSCVNTDALETSFLWRSNSCAMSLLNCSALYAPARTDTRT